MNTEFSSDDSESEEKFGGGNDTVKKNFLDKLQMSRDRIGLAKTPSVTSATDGDKHQQLRMTLPKDKQTSMPDLNYTRNPRIDKMRFDSRAENTLVSKVQTNTAASSQSDNNTDDNGSDNDADVDVEHINTYAHTGMTNAEPKQQLTEMSSRYQKEHADSQK